MRMCLVKVPETVYENPTTGRLTTVEKRAKFHEFGREAQYANNGDERISVSVAIVELENGKVITTDPNSIQFID